jgi:glc operon protein GlcG
MTTQYIQKLIEYISELVPEYMANPEDESRAKGVASVCIIDEEGNVYGKIFGHDKLRGRESFKNAWIKASQVWITGYKTNDYERMVFNGEINPKDYGISLPELVGWHGGQPLTLKDGTKLATGFSGFRGSSDLEIVERAMEKMKRNIG